MDDRKENRNVEEPSLATDDLVEECAEGLWLRLRDVILVTRKMEGFVF